MAIIPELDLTSLWVGDVPLGTTRADFYDEAGNPVQITDYSGWNAEMFGPDGISKGELSGTEHGQHLDFPWPETSILDIPGIYDIIITFTDALGVNVQCEPFRFVVQELDGWLTLEMARSQWPDAPTDDVLLAQILETARFQCETYAPILGVDAIVPPNYRHGQLLQARALYTASITSQNENVGIGDYQVRVFPLDWTIRAILRPKTARPVVA